MAESGTVAILPRHPQAAAQARHVLREVAPADSALTDIAALLLSEVVSNAVRHAEGVAIEVAIACHGPSGAITGAVFDSEPLMGGGHRCGARGADGSETGRGLDLLEALAGSWGVATVGDRGKWVWFQLTAD